MPRFVIPTLTLLALLVSSPGFAAEPDPAQELRQAASEGDRAGVNRLLAAGVDVDAASSSGGTALMYAAYGDHVGVVRDLLKAGAEPDLGDRFGDPAIHWAAYGGAASAVDALLEHGADPTVVTHHGDALAIAMRRGFPEIVESVARHTGTGTGDTPLHVAARGGDAGEVERLLAAGADVDGKNRIGYTPLMEAAREGRLEVVERLLAAGADPAHEGNSLGMGMTALHLAADRDQPEVARLLLSRGLAVDAGNAQGTTALAWALGEGSTDTALVLLDAGADPTLEDEKDFSALDMVEYLDDGELRRRIEEAAGRSADPPAEPADPRPYLEVPEGRQVLPDGGLDDGEWDDAAALPLGGIELLAKRDPRYLYLALRFVDGKHSGLDLYLATSPETRRLFHISSELGTQRFEGGSWSEYSWDVRGWVGNPVGFERGSDTVVIHEPDAFELQLSRRMLAAEGLGGATLRLAFLLKRPELAVPEGAQEAELGDWIELELPDSARVGTGPSPESADPALRLARLTASEAMVADMFGTMVPSGLPRELARFLVREDEELWRTLHDDVAAAFRETFDPGQIAGLVAFFESDLGLVWIERSPEVFRRQLAGLASEGSSVRRFATLGCTVAIVAPNLEAVGVEGESLSTGLPETVQPAIDRATSFCGCIMDRAAEKWGADMLAQVQTLPEFQAFAQELIRSGTCPLPVPEAEEAEDDPPAGD